MLSRLGQLIVRPPERLWFDFHTPTVKQHLNEVNYLCLSNIFKVEKNCALLEVLIAQLNDEKDRHRLIGTLLNIMIPGSQSESTRSFSILDQCRIVPRPNLNLKLGTFTYKPTSEATWHLVATSEEEELFSFAADAMMNTELFSVVARVEHNLVDVLLESDLNIRRLELRDLGFLLNRSDSITTIHADAKTLDDWMLEFWQYLNRHLRPIYDVTDHSAPSSDETVDSLLSMAGLQDSRIYRTRSDGTWSYLTPRAFEAGLYIVEPLDLERVEIKDLLMIDQTCAPFLLQEQESELTAGKSFKRFLRVFEKLEKRCSTTIEAFIDRTFSPESKDSLRILAIQYLESGCYEGHLENTLLRQLPMWRRATPAGSSEHIAANNARFCGFKEMLMPWVQGLSSFVEPEMVIEHKAALLQMEVPSMTHEQVWDIIKRDLPGDVKDKALRQQYVEFIQYLAEWSIKPTDNVTPNSVSIMCEVATLYNHQDTIFKAAFREQKCNHFLHPDLQLGVLRSFWLSLGLRARDHAGVMNHEHFLDCALVMDRRWSDRFKGPSFEEDSKTVASFIGSDHRQSRTWPITAWATLRTIPLFKVRGVPSDENPYRTN